MGKALKEGRGWGGWYGRARIRAHVRARQGSACQEHGTTGLWGGVGGPCAFGGELHQGMDNEQGWCEGQAMSVGEASTQPHTICLFVILAHHLFPFGNNGLVIRLHPKLSGRPILALAWM